MEIGSDKKAICLRSGTWIIDEPVTIPSNIKLKVELGVVLTKSGTGTLAINGEFEAPDDEIFKEFKSSGYDNYFRHLSGLPDGISYWEPGHPYTLNDRVLREGNNVYKCVEAGTSASSGGPTGNDPNADLVDGTVHWRFISDRTFWEKDHKYNPGERVLKKYNGCVYECISGGTSSEEGPTGNDPAVTITDGTVHWKFVEYLSPPIPTTADITFGKLIEKVYVTLVRCRQNWNKRKLPYFASSD
jgi:hypothetical protein